MWQSILSVFNGPTGNDPKGFMNLIGKLRPNYADREVIPALEQLVEMMIWGEQHDQDFFGLFYQENVMERL